MGHKGQVILPTYSSDNDLVNKCSDFFTRNTSISKGNFVNFEGQHLTRLAPDTHGEVLLL